MKGFQNELSNIIRLEKEVWEDRGEVGTGKSAGMANDDDGVNDTPLQSLFTDHNTQQWKYKAKKMSIKHKSQCDL